MSDQKIIDKIRAENNYGYEFSDHEIKSAYKSSVYWSVTGFHIALSDLSKAIKKSIGRLHK